MPLLLQLLLNKYTASVDKKFSPFTMANLSQIVDFVKPMWTFSEWEESFRNCYAEAILRNSYFENELAFQTIKENRLYSALFLQRLSDKNNFEQWLFANSTHFDEQKKASIKLCGEYLSYMDTKVYHLMKDTDIKLSLFVGLQKGWGKILFDEIWLYLKSSGYKNMYLWTDCECNWEWYLKNGFTLIEESVYEPYTTKTRIYTTYIFKKSF